MQTSPPPAAPSAATDPGWRRRWGRIACWGCGGCASLPVGLLALLFLLLQKVPATYPPVAKPIPPPTAGEALGGGLPGFESPYVGHTGSWNGKGGAWGGDKLKDMDVERSMGLRWTFMPVYWRALEPEGPVDLSKDPPEAWRELDAFVIAAQKRGLNILIQAPVVGGNAGGPPRWAGRQHSGKAAPENMEALGEFAGKLAARYAPGGTLARQQGWGTTYGVRAWELDNEPADYLVNWAGQAEAYAEFVTRAAAEIRKADRQAVILSPALAGGSGKYEWLEEALKSPKYSVGPPTDAVSFHLYEGLDTAFAGRDRTIERAFSEVREVFERSERAVPGLTYSRKREYWHTEGNFDFIGALSAERRAAWRMQFFTRAFAAGVRKVVVMDASPREQDAVRAYVAALPDPFPIRRADREVTVVSGKAEVFRCSKVPKVGKTRRTGSVWVLWTPAGTGPAVVEVPATAAEVETVTVEGVCTPIQPRAGRVRVQLPGDAKMAAPVLVIDSRDR